jgi:hypothetical protein
LFITCECVRPLTPEADCAWATASFSKSSPPGLEAFVMFHTHDHQVAFPFGREIDGRIFLMAEAGDFPGFIAQGGDGFDNGHGGSSKKYLIKIYTLIKSN